MFMRSLMAFSLVKYLFLLAHLFPFFMCRTFRCIKALQFLAVARWMLPGWGTGRFWGAPSQPTGGEVSL